MKQLILIAAIILMAGVVHAHDPNEVTTENPIRMSINNAGVMTVDVLLTPEQAHVYSKTMSVSDIIKSIKAVLRRRVAMYRSEWLKRQPTTEMD